MIRLMFLENSTTKKKTINDKYFKHQNLRAKPFSGERFEPVLNQTDVLEGAYAEKGTYPRLKMIIIVVRCTRTSISLSSYGPQRLL